MNWQEWIVAVIVLLCVSWIIHKLIRFFRSSGKSDSPCANCVAGCDLKTLFEEKQQECKTKQKSGNSNKKSCC